MKTKTLVTGATGKVGYQVVHQLTEQNIPVRAGIHSKPTNPFSKNELVESTALDFDNPKSIEKAMEGIEQIFLITPPHFKQVDWAVFMIDKAKEMGVKRIVRLSVLAAAMEPGIQLGRWHRTVERYLQNSGLDWTIIRPSPFMQNFLGMYPSTNGIYKLPADQGKVTHIDVRDVASATVKILTENGHNKKIYMITGGEPLDFYEMTKIMSTQTTTSIKYEGMPTKNAQECMINSGRPEWLAKIMDELFAAFRSGAVGITTPTFYELTNLPPKTFDEFAKDYSHQIKQLN